MHPVRHLALHLALHLPLHLALHIAAHLALHLAVYIAPYISPRISLRISRLQQLARLAFDEEFVEELRELLVGVVDQQLRARREGRVGRAACAGCV